MAWIRVMLICCAGMFVAQAFGAASDDPLQSVNWGDLRRRFFGNANVEFDERVKVTAPSHAEDSLNVPIGVSVEGLSDVEEVMVIADLNPIVKVLQYFPIAIRPALSFRVKLQQSTPVRALARTRDGVWHAGGVWVEAAGGGCTAPSLGRGDGSWSQTLNQVHTRLWAAGEAGRSGERLRLMIMHPMDTGLAPGIPAFYIEQLRLTDADGAEYMRILTFEPVSENPVFSFDFLPERPPHGNLTLSGRDNNGNLIAAKVVVQ